LFVGTYSAAPYRIDFAEFHPEKMLSFLPHELDFTHLRLMWREWKEKAQMSVLGRAVTPYGPHGIDSFFARMFRLRGDLVPDQRLINYPVAWLATEQSSALDGTMGNVARLTSELDELGIVDRRLSFYMPLRLREFGRVGFAGFEGRYYSLFPSYGRDMAPAADFQQLLLMISYRMALEGIITAAEIPDDPTSESERRQPFFFGAAGLPAFYVHKNSGNELLKKILQHATSVRSSWRHPDYFRVSIRDYRDALLAWLSETASECIEQSQAGDTVQDLRARLADTSQQASRRIVSDVMRHSGHNDPLKLSAREFNRLAEEYYREDLRRENLREAYQDLCEDTVSAQNSDIPEMRELMRHGVRVQDPVRFLESVGERLVRDDLTLQEVTTVLNLLLVFSTLSEQSSRQSLK
jgi:hypothetical protein